MFTPTDFWLHEQRLQDIREETARDRRAAQACPTPVGAAALAHTLARTLVAALAAVATVFAKG